MSMQEDLNSIEAQVRDRLASVENMEALEQLRVGILGKKGSLTTIMRSMGKIAPEERPAMGKLANTVRANVDSMIKERKIALAKEALHARMQMEAQDITLPGRYLAPGTQHLINQIREEIEDIFCGLGYIVADGPYVETTYYNFTALNAPENHPSRSAKDSFYLYDNAPEGKPAIELGDSDVLLRTQTSDMQIHYMEENKPPIYMICPGTVFRPDTPDANHLPQFNQVEGLVVDEGITFGDLKGTLDYFCREIFGKDRATRYRPHFPARSTCPAASATARAAASARTSAGSRSWAAAWSTPTSSKTSASTPRSTRALPSASASSASRPCVTTCPTCACSWKATCASCASSSL